jgi:hypothetical protein
MTGTAVATRDNKPNLVTGAQVAAIVPRTLDETYRLAQALASSKMVPASLDSPEKVMVAIIAGAELGLAPFQSLQSFAVINGKPAIWGDGLMAVVRSQGFKVREWLEGEGDGMVARCELTRPDNGDQAWGEFSVADAKKAGLWGKQGPWQNYPKRMLKMRARAFALRDGAADVLRGFQIREEVEDYDGPISRDPPAQARAAAAGTGMRARLEARSTEGGFDAEHVASELDRVLQADEIPAQFDHVDPETGEIIDPVVDPPADDGLPIRDDSPEPEAARAEGEAKNPPSELADASLDPIDWAAAFTRGLDALGTAVEVEEAWKTAKRNGFVVKLKAAKPAMADALVDAVNARIRELSA